MNGWYKRAFHQATKSALTVDFWSPSLGILGQDTFHRDWQPSLLNVSVDDTEAVA